MLKNTNSGVIYILILLSLNLRQLKIQAAISYGNLDSYYTAGVVEFRPAQFSHPKWTSAEKLQDNLNGYIDILTSEEATETDIIVFPEMTLNDNNEPSYVPDPKNIVEAPCDRITNENGAQFHDFFIKLSCHARNVSKYIVINIVERSDCLPLTEDPRPCSETGYNLFNTNVVFDRNGVVISRYRKIHLWGEPRNVTFLPENGYFDTDFGVRFGHFICFDLLFYTPAQEMVKKFGIRDFVYPTMWFSQLPFLTAVQIQSAWSYANDVNFLASGASFPAFGTTGSGIYAGVRGALQAVMSHHNSGQRKLLVARLEKKEIRAKTIIKKSQKLIADDDLFLKQDDLESYETLGFDLSDGHSLNRTICQYNHNLKTKFCCNFELKWKEESFGSSEKLNSRYNYRLGVFNGLRKEAAPETNFLRNCALFACTGSSINDCGKVFADNGTTQTIFEHLAIEGSFPIASEVLIMPNSLRDDYLPIPVEDFRWNLTEHGSTYKVRYEISQPIGNLLTFSIYGNYFDSHDAIDENILCTDGFDIDTDIVPISCDDERSEDGVSAIFLSHTYTVIMLLSFYFIVRNYI